MNLPLRFCVSCGRALSSKESGKLGGLKALLRAGVTKRLEDPPAAGNFDRAKRSYGFERSLRQLVRAAINTALFIALYALVFTYAMKDPKVHSLVQKLLSRPAPASQPESAPAGRREPQPAGAAGGPAAAGGAHPPNAQKHPGARPPRP